ncbi:GNAT family N-acetyltransferase [Specibacter sp. AOP5-B1-6]|uniref:GNAT family N-acetyltransferase n=1 Tax=Specibacter sp. AOP5-B1-6 TaxID=3457653 RepID=UPI00402B51F6
MPTTTEHLVLSRPGTGDVDGLHVICADPRVWTHFPSLRHTDTAQTSAMVEQFMATWDQHGLGPWVARLPGDPAVIGHGGCSVKAGAFWNLGYRLSPEVQGRGLASELSLAAMRQAKQLRPELPVVAYLLEHNAASARVAQKVGLTLVHRGPDAGNPDTNAIRLVYADRPLTPEELAATLA